MAIQGNEISCFTWDFKVCPRSIFVNGYIQENENSFISVILFYGYKFLKMGIQGNECSFFAWKLKVCPRRLFENLKFVPKRSITDYCTAELIYNLLCLLKTSWDCKVPVKIEKRWKLLINFLKNFINVSYDQYLFTDQNIYIFLNRIT